ncbi:MAG: substrate-binding domain-containing protein, partial [Actinomycetia bacterium]|nr:substrate-binding domain-containing protein [Actinomycetes bacterium]
KVDGVIVSRNLVDSRMLEFLLTTDMPFVLIGTTDLPGVLQIDNDNRAACRELTRLLLARWDGRPGLIAGARSHLVSRARADGFADVAGNAPVVWDAVDESSIVAAFHELYGRGVRCFFCEDDLISGYVATNLRSGRLGIGPDSVTVASFYDSPTLEALNPEVPVVHFDAYELGARAARMLLARIGGEDVDNVTLPYTIVVRDNRPLTVTEHT